MKKILVLSLLLLLSGQVFSQNIKGKIIDDKGVPLPGANILNVANKASTASDIEGNFTINAKEGDALKISMIGTIAKTVKASSGMVVTLLNEVTTLSDIVVVGYGTRKAVDATMAVAKVKGEEISKQKVLRPDLAVQGKMTGVTIVGNDSPGSAPKIIVRGLSSIVGADTPPLFVVDGVYQNNINNLNSSTIESFEVLKDASALAIYGNQAVNGVVIITTKRGKGDIKIDVDFYTGVRNPLKTVKMASSNQYAYYNNLARESVLFSQDQPVNTNWFKEVTRTALYQNAEFNVSGGSEKSSYALNAGYYNEKSIIEGSSYDRTTLRWVNDYKLSDKLKLDTRVNIGFTNITPKSSGALTTAYRQSPIVPVYYKDGRYGQSFVGSNGFADYSGTDFNNVGNPVMQLDFQKEESKNINVILGFKLDYKIISDLKFTANFGGEFNNYRGYGFYDSRGAYLANNPTETIYPDKKYNSLTFSSSNNFEWNFNSLLTYNKKFGNNHDLELMGGVELIHTGGGAYLSGTRFNLPESSNYWQFQFSALGDEQYTSGGQGNDINKYSYFGRMQYKLMDKYLLTANVRYDGSSQFAPEYQWGFFPSFGAGWVVSKEKFLENSKVINFLKIRGGWGLLGDANIGRNIQTFSFGTSGYSFGDPPVPFVSNSQSIDKNLSWEETRSYSAGFEINLLDNRLKGVFDYYDKLNRNVIIQILAPAADGTSNTVPKHGGQVSNKGIEASLNWNDKINENAKYRFGVNFTNNKNTLEEVSPEIAKTTYGSLGNGQYTKVISKEAVGQPLGSYFIWEYAGLDNQGRMLFNNNLGEKVLYSALTEKDRKFMGSALPTTTMGIDLGFTYKRFEISTFSYIALGGKVYNGKKALRWADENIESSVAEDFWTPTNTNAANPAPFNQVPIASSYYLESGDFFRVNNIYLAYNLEAVKKFITSGQLYCNIINPFIDQKFSGFSPEINGSPLGGMGIELDSYPTLRSVVFGLKLNF
jgi:TonB-linked SusC/RagA family outer membrane protein